MNTQEHHLLLILTEAEYAYKLQREFIPIRMQHGYMPDGWLGMLLGMKMSFDLTDPENKEEILTQILNALGDSGKGPPIDGNP